MDGITTDTAVKCRLAGHLDYKAVMTIDENIYGGRDYLPELYHDFLHRHDTLMAVVELHGTIVSMVKLESDWLQRGLCLFWSESFYFLGNNCRPMIFFLALLLFYYTPM